MSNVSILPQGATVGNIETIENTIQATKTYKIKDGKVVGFCDGKEALEQTIFFILSTERYKYLIYSDNYGSEFENVPNIDRDILESELKRRINEALIQDDRIESTDNYIFNYDEDSVLVKFTVFSIYGDLEIEKEVS
ncbi:DUF2634 domain-containing protein [Clostridium neonatale]|uniref:Phage-like element PBSX protein XkdS n=3 Tax=Clostridium neonatale TaxID=137838 RepID=A0AAD1YD09_9CLOT|nr:DUF2634 domain-containing protein [Clostridium neonatale]CAI3227430.1 putative Phage-like element PBSX protein XkdS [Clostridium neonatale]CAI3545295.1 putative Phage-like element PBSX protein XkdS [Clostridium neonatale]CAI3585640.1 putative Phage-like element PBSX protein XkdS [Clostridium neonatale]CAI3619933.1 putative Phage-like element PBSX protein XkdS [Clostridium neonatale]CAI3625744.1 putative Phage-like element PBSX protein XkdS [Clostridium neonatale]